MRTKRTLTRPQTRIVLFFLGLALFVISVAAQQPEDSPSAMKRMGPGMMGMAHDAQTMAEMSAIHELVVNHDRIKRTVTNLSDGIRTVTESDDPKIAQFIKEHVATMDQRVSAQSDPGLPIESPALRTILRNRNKVQSKVETTAKGVIVTQTSSDPETVAALQQHASEVSDLVQRGMIAIHEAMMSNGGTPAVGPQVHDQSAISQNHDQHHAEVNKRGDQVMGFDQAKTTHHFRLTQDGGVIDVATNDPTDAASRDQIRQHLSHIAELFAGGNFTAPMLIHAQTPPGVPAMKRLKSDIQYRFEETERGGGVRITTNNREAIAAVHEFLRFQIKDHATGDSGKIENP